MKIIVGDFSYFSSGSDMMNCIRGGRYNNGTDKFVLVNVFFIPSWFF